MLLVDDIQFLANKERTQEEFFHTFNTLYTSQKQIILSSDSPPRNIPTLEERLRSRFEWGLIADIQPPDLETKVAILRRKADAERPGAARRRGDLHRPPGEVERARARGAAQPRARLLLAHRQAAVARARQARRSRTSCPRRAAAASAADEIIKLVARHYGLKVSEIKSKSNSQQIVFPRQVAMYLCKKLTDLSFPEIGKLFNDKHHSTVMYSVEKIEQRRATDPDLDRIAQQHRNSTSPDPARAAKSLAGKRCGRSGGSQTPGGSAFFRRFRQLRSSAAVPHDAADGANPRSAPPGVALPPFHRHATTTFYGVHILLISSLRRGAAAWKSA